MVTLPVQSQYMPNDVPTGDAACEGRKSITVQIDFSLGLTYTLDLTAVISQQLFMKSVQSIYVDNSANDTPMVFTMGVTNQRIIVPRNMQAYIPILQPNPPVLQIVSTSAVTLKVHLLNFFLPPAVWSAYGTPWQFDTNKYLKVTDVALDALISNGALTVSTSPYGINTDTDRSGTITVGGTRQALFTSNVSRKRWIISNPTSATEILQFSLGSNTAGLIDLAPGSTWDESGSSIATMGVWVVAATAAHAFTAYEFP